MECNESLKNQTIIIILNEHKMCEVGNRNQILTDVYYIIYRFSVTVKITIPTYSFNAVKMIYVFHKVIL